MKKIMFYCQHILGMGHLVRSMEIVRGLVEEFQVCFINGGEIVQGFEVPSSVELVNLPALKTDTEFKELQVVDFTQSLEEVQEIRKQQLLKVWEQFQPDILIIELFPFGRKRFAFELIPLLEQIQKTSCSTKVVCSLRDILVEKKNQALHEENVCQIMNKYFDMLLIHGDPNFIPLEKTFSKVHDLKCEVHYTGYVVQALPQNPTITDEDKVALNSKEPMILVSVGSGRFGHELLDCVLKSAPILEETLPHKIYIFTGSFFPQDKFSELQSLVDISKNVSICRYTSRLLSYMEKADLSISMGGYNTTMNILSTGVKAMILPFTGNGDMEQNIRAIKLEEMGVLDVVSPQDLERKHFSEKIVRCLNKTYNTLMIDLQGVKKTLFLLKSILQ